VFFVPISYGLECGFRVLRMAGTEDPCITIIMSLAKTTIFRFGALKINDIRSLIIIFHKAGPETDPCGHPLVTPLEIKEFPSVTWAVRSLKKSLTML
jgi:hypothetical protein